MADSPRGQKRTADEAFNAPRRIRALAQDVVNKIAAGEIIIAPVNALKEMIENAVDAGSTSIDILVKEGGLKLLQITDNGGGIHKEDLPILCERHTTSKLKTFEDLSAMTTYGFRGEALASISHIAHLTVTSRTNDTECAYKASYAAGKLIPPKSGQTADPKPCAGNVGTQIQVEDLFFNVPNRRRAFRSASDEYAKILDMVGKYAVHCKGVGFTCKKYGEAGTSLSINEHMNVIDRIRNVHNATTANDLIQFSVDDAKLGVKIEGWASSVNFSSKKTTLLLFINHRSVESSSIKKALEQAYSPFLPRHGHPFVYLSLDIDPARVDVNVHPTKREVNFLNEDEIIEIICQKIVSSLGQVDTSRTFTTQSLLTTKRPTQAIDVDVPMHDVSVSMPSSHSNIHTPVRTNTSQSKKIYENALVRTDSSVRKITSMLPPANLMTSESVNDSGDGVIEDIKYTNLDKEAKVCQLKSIKMLRAAVREDLHNDLTTSIAQHTFVGVVDYSRRLAAIQSGVKLLLVDYAVLSEEYFYQLALTDFGNFGTIKLDPVLDLKELLKLGAERAEADLSPDEQEQMIDYDWEQAVERVYGLLLGARDMLDEYFGLCITLDGKLQTLPLLIKGYTPSMAMMPCFLLRLGPRVEWDDEMACFETFLGELATWYVPEPLPDDITQDENNDGLVKRKAHIERALEHVLFPAFRSRLIATSPIKNAVLEVADLKGLYRVFERC